MTTICCNGCSEPITENLNTENYPLGRCCYNLPSPWVRGRDGLYTSTEDEDADRVVITCEGCGSSDFEATEHQAVRRYVNFDYDDFVAYMSVGDPYDSDTLSIEIRCINCGAAYHGDWDYE